MCVYRLGPGLYLVRGLVVSWLVFYSFSIYCDFMVSTTKSLPSPLISLIPIVILVSILYVVFVLSGTGAIVGGGPVALLIATGVASFIGIVFYKVKWEDIEKSIQDNVLNVCSSIIMLLLIGALSGIWMISGIIPSMVYYGVELLNPNIFLVSCCITCAVVSVVIGSSWTTIATMGVAFMGIGQILGFSEGWIAGAVISGAYFGDKISPVSETTVLASSVTETPLFTHIGYMKYTTVPSMLIALTVFAIVGFTDVASGQEGVNVDGFADMIADTFVVSPWLLLVPAFTFFLIVKKVPSLIILFLAVLVACLFAAFVQTDILVALSAEKSDSAKSLFLTIMTVLYDHTHLQTGNELLNELVATRGITGMLDTICLIICSMCFGGAMYAVGMIESITRYVLKFVRKGLSMVASTVFSGLFLNTITADQYISIVLTGNMFKELYKKKGYESCLLSRTVEDSITVTSVLIPWNTCGMAQSAVLGIATISYLPYCVFNFVSPFMSIIVMALGVKIRRLGNAERG